MQALKQRQSFLLDAALDSYDVAEKNIRRCIKRKRFIQILSVYQRPGLAWEFVQAREKVEGCRIRVDTFYRTVLRSPGEKTRVRRRIEEGIPIRGGCGQQSQLTNNLQLPKAPSVPVN